ALDELVGTVEQLRRTRADRDREVASLDELLGRTDEVRSGLAERDELTVQEKACRKAQAEASRLHARRTAVLEQIEGERRLITARLAERHAQVESLTQRTRELSRWDEERARIEAALAGSEDPREAIEQTRSAGDEQRAAEARVGEELRTIDASLADIKERTAILRRGEGECPVCGSALDADHRKQVEQLIRKQTAAVTTRKQAARAERETARKEASRCDEEVRRLERTLAERESLVAQREAVLARLESAPTLHEELAGLEAATRSDERALADDRFASELRTSATRLTGEIESLYDAAGHETLRARLDELTAIYVPLAGRLEAAAVRREAVRRELEETSRRLSDAERLIGERRAGLEELAGGLDGLDAARAELDRADRNLAERRKAAVSVETELARLTERLDAATRAASDREAEAEAERAAATEHRRYSRLAEAFGRGGIPDLIIDNARPDLEQEANEILGRLTDWEMSVHFAMQRGTKSGKVKETFDVLVHHDGGLRDFAMFSGGEAFRIAFAVRLALSKLLVRRAGARLETLVIDEGFGTQDPAGRERLIEAINLARGEFAKVLVITHLEDLKEAFGTQIQVTKDPKRGSVIGVVPA
ncbi:MAG: SbcC/MukB-like Walker B domain-containing protein, partial [bacterium]